ncbi:type II toxin-antitoxin system HicB family antitoxin [Acidobacteria bacterium AH-259-L09]|nr:type II toxin-antitoxin system HicB family antitoxin [Acidobacteria bacterium AH-259-L09]
MPENVLRQVDEYVKRHNMSRSAFLTRAALHEIEDEHVEA